jgi:hypothetical protein
MVAQIVVLLLAVGAFLHRHKKCCGFNFLPQYGSGSREPMRIRFQVRHRRHKKLDFNMKNILFVICHKTRLRKYKSHFEGWISGSFVNVGQSPCTYIWIRIRIPYTDLDPDPRVPNQCGSTHSLYSFYTIMHDVQAQRKIPGRENRYRSLKRNLFIEIQPQVSRILRQRTLKPSMYVAKTPTCIHIISPFLFFPCRIFTTGVYKRENAQIKV